MTFAPGDARHMRENWYTRTVAEAKVVEGTGRATDDTARPIVTAAAGSRPAAESVA